MVWRSRYAAASKPWDRSNQPARKACDCARASFITLYAAELRSHFEAEERILFSKMSLHVPESEELIADLTRDHESVRLAIPKLQATVGLGKVIFDLGDLLERHIRREERELFPLFEQHAAMIGADEIAEKLTNFLELARRLD